LRYCSVAQWQSR